MLCGLIQHAGTWLKANRISPPCETPHEWNRPVRSRTGHIILHTYHFNASRGTRVANAVVTTGLAVRPQSRGALVARGYGRVGWVHSADRVELAAAVSRQNRFTYR